MKFSVACNFDPELIPGLAGLPVYELYGKLPVDDFGGGRGSLYQPKLNKDYLADYVKETHKSGIKFNYLINAICMGNIEVTRTGQKNLRKLLDWLSKIEVDSLTVSNLLLLKMIKKCYPHFYVKMGAHLHTNKPLKTAFWEEHGAQSVVINETNVYRDFNIMKAIRKSVTCDLQIIVNNSCRYDCAYAIPHATALNHDSQTKKSARGIPMDYQMLFCISQRILDPVNLIRANWIRPEDLHYYEAMGYTDFKIVERNTPTPLMIERVKAYANRKYDGNLLDLIQPFGLPREKYTNYEKHLFSPMKYLRILLQAGPVRLSKFKKIDTLCKTVGLIHPRPGEADIVIDNASLNGFMDHFVKKGCADAICKDCGYCHAWAQKTVKINPEFRESVARQYDGLFNDFHTGKFWLKPRGKTGHME